MKKLYGKIYHNKAILLSLLVLGIALIGIVLYSLLRCKHEWKEATCTEPRTCILCDEIEGEPLGHTWEEATCTTPKTCDVCGVTEGEVLGHTWEEATCITPKTCDVCGTVEGEPLGHTWLEATCTVPKTCDVCGAIEGEPLGHTWLEATCIAPKTCNICGLTEGITNENSHTLDDRGKCNTCGRQIGFALNKSNIYQYIKLTNGDGGRGSIRRVSSSGLPALPYEVKIEPIKNVKFKNVYLTYKIDFYRIDMHLRRGQNGLDYFEESGKNIITADISLDEMGYGDNIGDIKGRKSVERGEIGGTYYYSVRLDTVKGYVIE